MDWSPVSENYCRQATPLAGAFNGTAGFRFCKQGFIRRCAITGEALASHIWHTCGACPTLPRDILGLNLFTFSNGFILRSRTIISSGFQRFHVSLISICPAPIALLPLADFPKSPTPTSRNFQRGGYSNPKTAKSAGISHTAILLIIKIIKSLLKFPIMRIFSKIGFQEGTSNPFFAMKSIRATNPLSMASHE